MATRKNHKSKKSSKRFRRTRSKRGGYDSGRDDKRLSNEWIEHILHFYYDQEDISDKISRDDLKEILKKLKYDEDYRCPITGEPIKRFGYQAMAKVDAFLKYGDHIGGKRKIHKRKTKKNDKKKTKKQTKKIRTRIQKKSKRKNRKTRSKKGGVKKPVSKQPVVKKTQQDRKQYRTDRLKALVSLMPSDFPEKSIFRAFTNIDEQIVRDMSMEQRIQVYNDWRIDEAVKRRNNRYIKNQQPMSNIQGPVKKTNIYFPEAGPLNPEDDKKMLKNVDLEDTDDEDEDDDAYRPGTPAFDDDEKIADILLEIKNIKSPDYKKELELDLDLLDDYEYDSKYDDK